MKELMLGNKAVARGLYEAGVAVASSYPGTPVRRLLKKPLSSRRSIVNGHLTRRSLWRLLLVQAEQARDPTAR